MIAPITISSKAVPEGLFPDTVVDFKLGSAEKVRFFA